MEEKDNAVLTEEEKEEELRKTIKMEPILETTELTEETATNKKEKIKRTNILLIFIIIILLCVFGYIIYKYVL